MHSDATQRKVLLKADHNEERCGMEGRYYCFQDLSNWHLNWLIKCEIGFMLCYPPGDMLP